MFVIEVTIKGKKHRRKFRTIELANDCASEIFAATGIVVGIERA